MKLKYNFSVHKLGDGYSAVAVGKDHKLFNGTIKLNETGKFIFEILSEDIDFDGLITKMCEKYGIDKQKASEDIIPYIEKLKSAGLVIDV